MNEQQLFTDRAHAGAALAKKLVTEGYDPNSLVLALPRGGVPVAHEISSSLRLPLDIVLIRKIGVPGQKEVAMGAVAKGGVHILNSSIIKARRVDSQSLTRSLTEEVTELQRREKLYRGDRPQPVIAGRHVILVDDGLATGASMKAALTYVRREAAASATVAVPIAAPFAAFEFRSMADRVICLATPDDFQAVSLWYDAFPQVSDEEVVQVLQEHWQMFAEA